MMLVIAMTRHTAFQVTSLSDHFRDDADDACPKDAFSGQQVHEGISHGLRQRSICQHTAPILPFLQHTDQAYTPSGLELFPQFHRNIVSLVRRTHTGLGELLNISACILMPG